AAAPASDEERRLWAQAGELSEMLARSGRVLDDPALTAHVQRVADRLFPEFKGRIRVRILKAQSLNAFALPNGDIYLHEGILARFRNESQLAALLGHEGTHFVDRHSFQSSENVKSTTALGTVLAVVGVPAVGLAANLLVMSSVTGYSRELEAEADAQGYKRLVAAGYDPREAPKLFKLMMDEVKASGEDEPFFFSTHPALKDRYDNYLRLSKDAPAPRDLAPDGYLATFAELRLASLRAEVSMARCKQVIALLKEPERRGDYPPYVDYYLGEAYRQRGDKGDDALTKTAYLEAIAAAPDFAPAHRALGMQLLKTGAYDDAIRELETYLSLAQGATDRAYARMYLDEARKRKDQGREGK
ncbi:MAG: M48 family metalloprotease, partial [Burkholderiales bacterium]